MADILKIIKSRKTTYEFSSRPVTDKQIEKILEAGRMAPSAHNAQNWSYIIVKDTASISELLKACYYGEFHITPALIIAVVMEPIFENTKGLLTPASKEFAESHKFLNIGTTTMSMILEAESLGIASCILSPKVKDANRILGVPEGRQTLLLIGLGHEKPGAYQKKRERHNKNDIIFLEKYGQRQA